MLKFKVKELALEKGITSAPELARKADLGQQTVYNLWDNKRDDAHYSTLRAIARVLSVSPDDLVEDVSEESHKSAKGDKIRGPRLLAA